ncbi:MAG: hypothetical protein Q7V05_14685 [Methanoregula sp.]|nr:hypothetical protein [Methanoregula sp.]
MQFLRRTRVFFAFLVCIALLCCPVNAADQPITRTISPQSPGAGEVVTVTLDVPPSFFGGIIEQLPEGFTFESTSHPHDGVQRNGQKVIFALTGENTVQYTIRAPSSGCGVIQGRWENVGIKAIGTIPATVIAVAGTDPSGCSVPRQSPGFGVMTALGACLAAALVLLLEGVKR